jgi:uncharacterized protein (AIM24 family)
MKVTIKGNKVTIEGEIGTVQPSASGKTLVLLSSRGNLKTDQSYNGQPVTVGLNVYIPNSVAATPAAK